MAASVTPLVGVPGPLPTSPTTEKPLSRNAQRAIKQLQLHRSVQLSPWWEAGLRPRAYNQVLDILKNDQALNGYVEDKVRYDYDIRRHRFIVRMPCPTISATKRLYRKFRAWTQTLCDITYLLPEEAEDGTQAYTKREPDISSGHDRAHYPGVILEVCYLQKRKSVSYLAEDYILNTDGSINMVIALDIDYQGSQKASFTVWQPEPLETDGVKELRAKTVIEAVVFRTDDGSPAEGVFLQIPLQNFAPKELSQSYGDIDQDIRISSQQLCDFLPSAETRQRVQTQQEGIVHRLEPGTRKRRRTRTPSETSSSEDEGQTDKRVRRNKRNSQSSDYRPSSSSGDSTTLRI